MNENTISYKLDRIKNATDRMRTKTGVVSGVIEDVASAVENMRIINNQNKTITRNGAYNADEGYTGLGTVNVNVDPLLGTKSVTENGTYNAGDDMVQGYSSVEVNVSPNVMEKNITSNGEFVSQNDGVDGYDIVRVNVEPLLGTKTVTTNGTYNAEDDMVQGYSSITVNVPTSGGTPVKSNIYRVPTIEARDAITDMVEGDMCAVIENEVRRITIGDKLKTILFPETVVLDSPIGVDPETGSEVFLNFNISKGSYRLEGQCTKSRFELMYEDMDIGDMGQVVRYESSDGLTYTRKEGSMEKYVIPIDYTVSEHTYDDDRLTAFVLTSNSSFDGIFKYSNNSWEYADINILADAKTILNGSSAYTSNGIVHGTLLSSVANTFDDAEAEIYFRLCTMYNNSPEVIAPEDSTALFQGKKIYTIPYKNNKSILNMSNAVNAKSAFSHCTSLVYLPPLDTSNVTNMNSMFFYCDKLISFPELKTSNVTDMASMFSFCNSLESAPTNLDTHNVTTFEDMFHSAGLSGEINLTGWNTSKATKMKSMFNMCSRITSLDLSTWDTSNVTDMSSMFYGCNFERLDIRNFNFSKVSSYESMLKYIPANCLIIVKDEAAKNWITSKFKQPVLTNVKTVAEYEASL